MGSAIQVVVGFPIFPLTRRIKESSKDGCKSEDLYRACYFEIIDFRFRAVHFFVVPPAPRFQTGRQRFPRTAGNNGSYPKDFRVSVFDLNYGAALVPHSRIVAGSSHLGIASSVRFRSSQSIAITFSQLAFVGPDMFCPQFSSFARAFRTCLTLAIASSLGFLAR